VLDDNGVSLDDPCVDGNGNKLICGIYPEGHEKEGELIPTYQNENNSLDKIVEDWWQEWFSAASINDISWIEAMLESKETPLAMGAVQVLTIDGIPVVTGITNGIGVEDLPLALTLFITSRGAAVVGTTSTFYQYSNGLNDTKLTDVIESAITTTAGFWPAAAVPAVHINLFYSAYRYWGGQLPAGLP
jgi:hypothetical protein